MATPLTNFERCEAEGDDSMVHCYQRRDVGGNSGMEAFHICKEVKQLWVRRGGGNSLLQHAGVIVVDVMPRGGVVISVAYQARLRRLKIRFEVGGLACLREV
jgi:hypothetical protein